jgi:3,4-dihydroxy-2-butanone 4-phosphate synthase
MGDKLYSILENVRAGVPIIIVDDESREDEGDLVLAAEFATEEALAFIIREARGLMCLPTTSKILDELELPNMVPNSTDKNGTPFTVSVDASDDFITTGMPVSERLVAISKFLKDDLNPKDLARPGHLFPLRAKDNLLMDRRGHTEASVTLMLLAKLKPVAIIAEIINDDGTMARGKTLDDFTAKHKLLTISVQEIFEAYYGQASSI